MASNKLHPIYLALDSHQYSRAVKLASSLPQSNHLGQALLAHAHLKSGHAVKSLLVIQSVLWFQSEQLEYEIQRLGLGTGGPGEGAVAVESAPKKGKKGSKHKPETPAPAPAPATVQRDLLEQVESPLILAKGWGQVNLDPQKPIITDETTLETLQITLQSMRLYATVFQMYASASSVAGATSQVLTKAYTSGLRLVPESLAEMQVFALQLARSRPESTLWAAQTALWQLEFYGTELDDTKKQMLPRLAESLAAKYAHESAEASLLYISTLQYQKKWQQVVTVLGADNQQLTTLQKGELEAHALEQLQQYELAQGVYEKLLVQNPQQWTYWKKILECAHFSGGSEGASIALESCLQKTTPPNSSRPCRSRHLIPCELACLKHRNDNDTTTATMEGLSELQDAIVQYGSVFAARASCAYSDLAPYIEQLLVKSPQEDEEESSKSLLEWAASQLHLQHDQKGEMDRSQLRSYIFAIQVTYKILSILNHDNLNHKFLPDWMDLVNNWRASQTLGTSKEGEGVQKENQPGDELILLAVQNLLFRKVDTTNLITAASLLEEAMVFSPYNASLKITAIDIYSKLNAVHRAYELYQALSIKHIQLDSCSYLISSKLVQGGLYNEAIELCNDILKFHTCIARETGEFAARSMDKHGTLSKADEFLHFFRNKMQPSLTLLDAKGRIMDCAPLLYTARDNKHTLGVQHGIVGGGESDLERVAYMIREAHNPLGAPSIMTVTLDDESSSSISDNCDFSILHHEILCKTTYATKETLLKHSIHRGLMHGLLVRLVLCMEVIKGPKKGKAPKPSEVLQKRRTSLLDIVDKISQFLESGTHDGGYQECMQAILTLVRTIVVISVGHEDKEDTLSNREEYATQQLDFIVIPISITWSIPTVCQFLPDMLVPLVVVFRITANLFSLFGWGKRKTRASTGALAKVASDMKDLVGAMREEMSSLPESDDERMAKAEELLGLVETEHCLQDSSTQTACQTVGAAQQLTHHRVVPFLDEILDELSSFQVEQA